MGIADHFDLEDAVQYHHLYCISASQLSSPPWTTFLTTETPLHADASFPSLSMYDNKLVERGVGTRFAVIVRVFQQRSSLGRSDCRRE